MDPSPKEYSCTNPLEPTKPHKRTNKFIPIKFQILQTILLAFDNKLSHFIKGKVIDLQNIIAAKWQGCSCVETNSEKNINQQTSNIIFTENVKEQEKKTDNYLHVILIYFIPEHNGFPLGLSIDICNY